MNKGAQGDAVQEDVESVKRLLREVPPSQDDTPMALCGSSWAPFFISRRHLRLRAVSFPRLPATGYRLLATGYRLPACRFQAEGP
jgi:hypothetical protein